MLQKTRFIGSVTILYVATFGMLGTIAMASHSFDAPVSAEAKPRITKPVPTISVPKIISGNPIRIIVPSAAIDLSVDKGYYDQTTGAWTLSDTHAQHAVMSAPSNDHAGTTFIYGHGTDAVFGKIGTNHPPVGSVAQVMTDTSHTFTYTLTEIRDFTPTDTSILNDTASGPPRLVIQTCTGIFSEWRTMFIFSLEKVDS